MIFFDSITNNQIIEIEADKSRVRRKGQRLYQDLIQSKKGRITEKQKSIRDMAELYLKKTSVPTIELHVIAYFGVL